MIENGYDELIGKILWVELTNGKKFCSKLEKTDKFELWFINRRGIRYMNRRDEISRVVVL